MNYNETNSTGLNKSYGLFLRRIEGRFNLSSKLLSNTNLNTDSNLLITKYNLKSLVNYICLSSILILSTSAGISYAALNATTANTIQGTKPVFDSSNTARKALGFKLDGTVYSERNGNLNNGTSTNYFASNKTLNDFIVPSLGDLFSGSTDYADTDGDVVDTTSPFTGTITFN